ncbi:type 1 glutamine amidotransferase [Companilactobacillus furfuricola]|uniref:type 1 glutamine amidotransferase n=1 Tax=Companilactobacillus furfuricola TaxID=1462575 RepID=UPI000F76ABE8|nr:type 1 glutamine amidotransferase [Companilactobacillus furfuricola]
MRINILQHTPNEGAGSILEWAKLHHHDVYTYYPGFFNGVLPAADETDMLVILGGPISPNDQDQFIRDERVLIKELLEQDKPIFGACFGAQQISKALGYPVGKSPVKEVGWGEVTLQSSAIPDLPNKLSVIHWHEEMFEIPKQAELLFSSPGLKNQGFVLGHHVVGLQFHLEPEIENVREMAINDFPYLAGSIFDQTAQEVIDRPVPQENKACMFKILDFITAGK